MSSSSSASASRAQFQNRMMPFRHQRSVVAAAATASSTIPNIIPGNWKIDGELEVSGNIVAFVREDEVDLGPDDVLVLGDVLASGDVSAFELNLTSASTVRGTVYATGDVVAFWGGGKQTVNS